MYKVMIADDEPFIIEGLYDALDWSAYELEIVGTAENGQAALHLLGNKEIHILITDISMPVMNGLALIRQARRMNPNLHVIILSGYNDFDYLKEGMQLGIENYLLKPINLQELKATLEAIIEKLDKRQNEHSHWQEEDKSVLRDNIVNRWLNKEIESIELYERAEVLGIDLWQNYYQVLLISTESEPALSRRKQLQLLERGQWGIPFHDRDGIAGLVLLMESKDDGVERLDGLRSEILKTIPDTTFHVALGDVVESEGQAWLSYAQAKKAMEFIIIHPERELLYYRELSIEKLSEETEVSFEWGEYGKLLAAKDKEALYELMDHDFARIAKVRGVSPGMIQSAALEMLIQLKMELNHIKKTELPKLIQEDMVQRIIHADSLQVVTEVIKEMTEKVIETLENDMKSPVIQKILKRIDHNCAEELSLKSLSSEYNIHPVYLGRLFQKEVNETFSEYLNRSRIEQAKTLLSESNLKVNEIARRVGYWEMGYFYKQFKKYVGISPKEYQLLL